MSRHVHSGWRALLASAALLLPGVAAASAQDEPAAAPGLRASWTWGTHHARNIGQIDWLASDETTVVDTVSWSRSEDPFMTDRPADAFALRLTGSIEIPTAGNWAFRLSSDEAAVLLIDGSVIVDDGRRHGFRTLTGLATLSEGSHEIEIRYLERSRANGLVLEWIPPGGSAEIVPASAFSHVDEPTPTESGGLRAYWSSDIRHAAEIGHVDWYAYATSTDVHNIAWRLTQGPFYVGGPTDAFAGRFVGRIVIPRTGTWRFNLGSDEAASLMINGEEVVYDGSRHGFRWRAGEITLSAGEHDIDVRYLERSRAAGLFLTWRGPGDQREAVVPRSAFLPGDDDAFGESGDGGLRAYWSTGITHATNLGQIDWDSYQLVSQVDRISWGITRGPLHPDVGPDSFAARLTGWIDIPESGDWGFELGSDDGAGLWIDGRPVVYDPTRHGFRWRDGSVSLSEGLHEIEVRYFERGGHAGLVLAWQPPDASHPDVIPASAFTPRDVSEDDGEGYGLRAYWSHGVSHATNLGQVDWDDFDHTTIERKLAFKPTRGSFYTDGPTDYFASRMLATIQIPASGQWTFNLGSDDAASVLIDGREVVYDGSRHGFRWRNGKVDLEAGPHDFEVRYLERGGSAGLTVTWKGPGVRSERIIPPSALTPRALSETTGEGLRAFWSKNVWHATRLGYIDWFDYDESTLVDNVSWPRTRGAFYAGGPTDAFACRLVGEIDIPTGGGWVFNLGSDDAASLIIDGEEVVHDGTRHGFRWRSGAISLSEGRHPIEVRFLERGGSAGLMLTWDGPGDTHESVIPASAFYPASESDFDEEEPGSLTAYWSRETRHAVRLGQIDWNRYDHRNTVDNIAWRLTRDPFYFGGPTDRFGARFYGTVNVPRAGTWRFHLGSNDAAELRLDGRTVVLDNERHGFRWREGVVTLTEGIHTIDVRYMERGGSAGVMLAWEGPGDDHPEIIPSSAFRPATAVMASEPGVAVDWYRERRASSLRGLSWSDKIASTREQNISFKPTRGALFDGGPTDGFAARMRGTLIVPETGWWTFGLGCDDGASLTIGDRRVAEDPNRHGFRWTERNVYLEAGDHPLEVEYFEAGGVSGLVVTWKGPSDLHESVIPPSAFRPTGRIEMVRWREIDPSR